MGNVGEISIKLTTDQVNFVRGLTESQNKLTGFVNKMKSTASAISSVGKSLSLAVTTPLVLAGKVGIGFNSAMEQAQVNFSTMLGSADKAKSMIADLKKFADQTPFEMQGLTSSAQMLLSFGMSAEDVMPSLKMLGDVSLGNQDKMNSLTYAFAQVQSTGRLMGQDLLQLINGGFNPLQTISEKTGISMKDLKKKMEDGAISSDMVTAAFKLATSEGGRFYKAMDSASKTFAGQWSTAKDAVNTALGEVLKPLFESLTKEILPSFIEKVKALTSWFSGLSEGTKKVILVVLGIIAALGPVLVILGPIISGIAALGAVIGFIVSPIGLVILAIAAVVGALVYFYNTNEDVRKAVDAAWKWLKQAAIDTWNWIKTAFDNIVKAFKKAMVWLGIWNETDIESKEATVTITQQVIDVSKSANSTLGTGGGFSGGTSGGGGGGGGGGAFGDETDAAADSAKTATSEIEDLMKTFKSLGTVGGSAVNKLSDAMKEFKDSVRSQTDALADFGSMFEKVTIDKMSPEKIMRRLQKTYKAMAQWTANLKKLQQKGVSESVINSLRGMGLEGAGITAGMAKMSKAQLSKAMEYMGATRYMAGQQAYQSVKFEHSGKIEVYGINSKGQLVDSGVIDMLSKEIKNGSQRYVNMPGPSKALK